MSVKELIFDAKARDSILSGIKQLSNAVKITLGPKGRNVLIEKSFGGPTVTKDGVTVAKEVELEDKFENMGAQMVKEVASKTNDDAGDGTTTATVLAEAIFKEGAKVVAAGLNPMEVKKVLIKQLQLLLMLVGEMRDLETIEAALTIAETGHLVFSTLHTNSAVQTVNRIIDVFSADQQAQIRTKLSFVLLGVISQKLIPRTDGKGRVLALEVLVPNTAIRSHIRDSRTHQIYSQMQLGQGEHGMITLNQSLANLVAAGYLTPEIALSSTTELTELKKMLGRG